MAKVPRYTGRDAENPERPEIEHYGSCDVCGALVGMRDLALGDGPHARSGAARISLAIRIPTGNKPGISF
jgi:hypothetical protein